VLRIFLRRARPRLIMGRVTSLGTARWLKGASY